jgi:hypothetical protein
MITWPNVLKFMAASTAALGVSAVVRRGRANRVSPFASLVSTFGVIIMASALIFASGTETVYVLVGGTAVCAIGFFLERITRLDGYDERVDLD